MRVSGSNGAATPATRRACSDRLELATLQGRCRDNADEVWSGVEGVFVRSDPTRISDRGVVGSRRWRSGITCIALSKQYLPGTFDSTKIACAMIDHAFTPGLHSTGNASLQYDPVRPPSHSLQNFECTGLIAVLWARKCLPWKGSIPGFARSGQLRRWRNTRLRIGVPVSPQSPRRSEALLLLDSGHSAAHLFGEAIGGNH